MSRCAAILALLSGAALAWSGFDGWSGNGLRHWRLLLHTFTAPVFLLSMLTLTVVWAGTPMPSWQRGVTWLLQFATVVSASAMLGAMLPQIGQNDLELLIGIHRWSAVVIAAFGALLAVVGFVGRKKAPA